jgi:hypothetical protein
VVHTFGIDYPPICEFAGRVTRDRTASGGRSEVGIEDEYVAVIDDKCLVAVEQAIDRRLVCDVDIRRDAHELEVRWPAARCLRA